MIDIENLVFARLAEAFDAAYPQGRRYSELVDMPAKFPALTFTMEDNYTYEKTQDNDLHEHHAVVLFTINAWSNLEGGGKQESIEVFQLADRVMQGLGFTRTAFAYMRNKNTKLCRATARYRGVVGEDHRIYRS